MNRQSWSTQEDEAICQLVSEFGIEDWTKIALKLKESYCTIRRTGKQCRERWYNHLNPQVNKKPWSSEQQVRLFELHKQNGNRWKDISRQFKGRTDNDIKNHFYSTLRRSLRRLNKILGQKNSTSQMRQIKPSVLSTIMSYIYEQQQGIDSELFKNLKDLPLLIFQFANFKPIKTNLKMDRIDDTKTNILQIFELISKFNEEYEKSKMMRKNKLNKRVSTISLIQKQINEIEQSGEKRGGSQQEEDNDNKLLSKTETCLHDHLDQIKIEHTPDIFVEDNIQEQNKQIEEIENIYAYRSRNISLDEQELGDLSFQDPEQPSIGLSQQHNLQLIVVGRHWQPKNWQISKDLRQFVDEVFEINYDMM